MMSLMETHSYTRRALGRLLWGLPGLAVAQQGRPRPIIVLLGAPGAGKTTQARLLNRKYRIPAISMADLLKREVGRKTPLGRQLRVALESGSLVNDDMMNDLIMYRLARKDAENGFILDGYPLNVSQARFLDRLAQERKFPAPLIIHLMIPDNVANQRLEQRGRADDKPRIIEQRISEFRQDIDPLLAYWQDKNLHHISGTQQPETVFKQIDEQVARLPR
jgi:adenylate kinase